MEALSKVPGKLPSGSLYRYFREDVGGECSIQQPGSQTAELCSSRDSLVKWRAGQTKVWDGLAREIIAKAGDPNVPLDLVFLVHGFNNTHGNSSQSYVKVRDALNRHANPGRTLRFVEVYWDGFRSPIGLGAWGKAQASGPLVGFHLRSLFNSLSGEIAARKNQDVDLKILSHSSGAFVLGATFGDPSAALPEMQSIDNDDYRTFVINAASHNGAYRIPQFDSLKIGLLAAATPSTTFLGSKRYPGGLLVQDTQILLSVNPHDGTLNKKGLGANAPGTGATGVGIIARYYCDELKPSGALTSRNSQFVGYDFDRSGTELEHLLKDHSFESYIEQADRVTTFMADLMSEEKVSSDTTEGRICD